MSLAHPEWLLPLLALWGAAAAALVLAGRRAARRRRRLLGESPASPVLARGDVLLLAALLALAAALLGPELGTRTLQIPSSGVDVVVLIDVSRSMDAGDVPPSRLERARRAAGELLTSLDPGDRAALAAFASRGVLLTPLTPDVGALYELLPALDSTLLSGSGGSRLAEGVREARVAFRELSERPRVLVVLSDGEDPEAAGDELALAELAGLRAVTVAFGSEAGAEIPSESGALRDGRGRVVRTRRDAARLEAFAAASGGTALRADAWGEVDAAALRAAVRHGAGAPSGFTTREVPVSRVVPCALAALVLLLAELGRPRWRRAAAAALPVFALVLAGAGAGEPDASRDERSLDAGQLLAIGVDRAESGELHEAERAFFAAAVRARDPALAADAYFDLGVAALQRGDLAAAETAFFDALALAPGDLEARFNLEWVLERRDAPLPAPGGAGEPEAESQSGEDETEATREQPADAAAQQGDAQPDASPDPAAEPEPGRGGDAPRRVPTLSDEEAERWLREVRDDPGRALRGSLRESAPERGRRRMAPAW